MSSYNAKRLVRVPDLNLHDRAAVQQAVFSAAALGKRWRVRLEYVGPNPKNKSKRSSKFWSASGLGRGDASVAFGTIGSVGTYQPSHYAAAIDKIYQKLARGYSVVDCRTAEAGAAFPSEYEALVKETGFGEPDASFAERRRRALQGDS
jgi:hypothetical protein